jgi:hypothetical protein
MRVSDLMDDEVEKCLVLRRRCHDGITERWRRCGLVAVAVLIEDVRFVRRANRDTAVVVVIVMELI